MYQDQFIQEYLERSDSRCDGFERFGINTPIQFFADLKGDCDTRTLLLYTLLSHYKYDTALLSSEFYQHSVIGVNLPMEGDSFQVNGENYMFWETTAQGNRAGYLPPQISNKSMWRISLMSKQ